MGRTESVIRKFPGFYPAQESDSIFFRLIDIFGKTLDNVESDLIKIMRAHWVDSVDNEGSKGFNTAQKGDLDKIFSLYLENLGGTSQLKQMNRPDGEEGLEHDKIYRERIKGLIQVLRSGASTKEGIIAIVAANLGIVGDDPVAENARNKIRIIEFMPEPIKTAYTLTLFEEFIVENPNIIDIKPEIRIHIRNDFEAPLTRPGIVNLTTGGYIRYKGTVKADDVLSFFPDGTIFLNGIEVPGDETNFFLPPEKSRLRLEAYVGYAKGEFNRSLFDYATFEQESLREIGFFDNPPGFDNAVFAITDRVADINVTIQKLNPASFTVHIPWDIPGFTEKLDDLPDKPRNQIKYIIDKVKAAGVFTAITYEKLFNELHEQTDKFYGHAIRKPLAEDHTAIEANFDIGSIQFPYPNGIEHEMLDDFITSGVFDYTQLDSLNTFA